MSAVKAYDFLSKRLEQKGWLQIGDAFSLNDAASSQFSRSYLLQFSGSIVTEQGDRSLIANHSFTLFLLLSGWQRDLQSIKDAMMTGEKAIQELLDPVGMAQDGILAVTLNSYELSPFDDASNDDKLLFVAEFSVKNALCIGNNN